MALSRLYRSQFFASKYSFESSWRDLQDLHLCVFTHVCTFGIQSKNHEKRFWQASSGRSTRPRKRSYQTAAARPGEGAKRGCTLARCSNSGSSTAPRSRIQPNFVKLFRICTVLFSKFHCFFQKVTCQKFTNFDANSP